VQYLFMILNVALAPLFMPIVPSEMAQISAANHCHVMSGPRFSVKPSNPISKFINNKDISGFCLFRWLI